MSLKSWLRRKTGRNKDVEVDRGYIASPLPLSTTQPRVLTTTPSQASSVVANSPLFNHLSSELRLAILEQAFGKQNLHMNLLYFDPAKPISARAADPDRHATANGYKKPPGKKAVYQWSSSICHRDYPTEFEGQRKTPFWYDPCHRTSTVGGWEHCEDYPGERPATCWLGIMGFLLSCRQA